MIRLVSRARGGVDLRCPACRAKLCAMLEGGGRYEIVCRRCGAAVEFGASGPARAAPQPVPVVRRGSVEVQGKTR